MSAILSVRKLTKHFRGLRAMSDVSFEIEEGTITSIVGPNGAGKSTLFNMITGYLSPTTGEIEFLGRSLLGLAPYQICQGGVARAFQIAKPFPELTVEENIWVAAEFGASGPRDPATVVDHALSTCRLDPLRRARADSLSVGDLRRLELARAIAARPRLLLADEPCAGLNDTETRNVADVLAHIRSTGVTVLFVEHDMNAVRRISSRVIVIEAGRKIAEAAICSCAGPKTSVSPSRSTGSAICGS